MIRTHQVQQQRTEIWLTADGIDICQNCGKSGHHWKACWTRPQPNFHPISDEEVQRRYQATLRQAATAAPMGGHLTFSPAADGGRRASLPADGKTVRFNVPLNDIRTSNTVNTVSNPPTAQEEATDR